MVHGARTKTSELVTVASNQIYHTTRKIKHVTGKSDKLQYSSQYKYVVEIFGFLHISDIVHILHLIRYLRLSDSIWDIVWIFASVTESYVVVMQSS